MTVRIAVAYSATGNWLASPRRSPKAPQPAPRSDFLGQPTCPDAPGYQPRSRHSARCGCSAPSVVSPPWPG